MLTDCFGENYNEITLADDTTYTLADIQTGSDFQLSSDDDNDWSDPNIAFILGDGTRMLVSYNKKCKSIKPALYDNITQYFCLSGLADIDGDKKPNKIGKDAYLFGSAKGIGSLCLGKQIGLCLAAPRKINDLIAEKGLVTYAECQANREEWGLTNSSCIRGSNTNWYAAVVRECGGIDKLMSNSDFSKIANYILNTTRCNTSSESSCGASGNTRIYYEDDAIARSAELGIPNAYDIPGKEIGFVVANSDALNARFQTIDVYSASMGATRIGYDLEGVEYYNYLTDKHWFICKL